MYESNRIDSKSEKWKNFIFNFRARIAHHFWKNLRKPKFYFQKIWPFSGSSLAEPKAASKNRKGQTKLKRRFSVRELSNRPESLLSIFSFSTPYFPIRCKNAIWNRCFFSNYYYANCWLIFFLRMQVKFC